MPSEEEILKVLKESQWYLGLTAAEKVNYRTAAKSMYREIYDRIKPVERLSDDDLFVLMSTAIDHMPRSSDESMRQLAVADHFYRLGYRAAEALILGSEWWITVGRNWLL